MTPSPFLALALEHLKFAPFHDWVAVLADSGEMQTDAGLVIAESEDFKPGTGVVLMVGPNAEPLNLTTGDKILFAQYAAQPVPTLAHPNDSAAVREARSRMMVVRAHDVIGRYA